MEPTNIKNDDAQCEALKSCLVTYIKDNDICKDSLSFPIGSTVAMQHEDEGQWMHGV